MDWRSLLLTSFYRDPIEGKGRKILIRRERERVREIDREEDIGRGKEIETEHDKK